jgi:hypothetical protein
MHSVGSAEDLHLDRRLGAVRTAAHKLSILIKNFSKHSCEDNSIQLAHITRRLISSILEIKYNLPYEEMKEKIRTSNESEQLKEKLCSLIDSLSSLEFQGVKVGKKDVLDCANILTDILQIAEENLKKEKGSRLKRILTRLENKLGLERLRKAKEEETTEAIYKMLLEGHRILASGNRTGASQLYRKIRELYSKLPPDSKKRLLPDILYYYRKIVGSGN